jgi:riboflavin kinase/FMN adenylyltransferase
MELIRGRHNLRRRHHGCVATIGNFDGVHLGHQAVLAQLVDKAHQLGLPAVIVMFEPHPQEYFAARVTEPTQRRNAPARLTRLREKLQSLQHYAVDRVLCIRFNENFARLSAEDFIDRLLVEQLGVRCLIVGDDFRFGHRRQGDLAMLQHAGERVGFQVVNMHTFNIDGGRVSSTRIREALWGGDLNTAGKLLGRPYHMSGRIVHGDKRGRKLGFPTANIYLHRQVSPLRGVFAVSVFGLDHEPLDGVANIGVRPSVDGQQCLLEVHLMDFVGDIYGRHVKVMFIERLRDERRFETLDALKQQIAADVRQARTLFANNGEQIRQMQIES